MRNIKAIVITRGDNCDLPLNAHLYIVIIKIPRVSFKILPYLFPREYYKSYAETLDLPKANTHISVALIISLVLAEINKLLLCIYTLIVCVCVRAGVRKCQKDFIMHQKNKNAWTFYFLFFCIYKQRLKSVIKVKCKQAVTPLNDAIYMRL